MYEEHPVTAPTLPPHTVLWRYLDFTKFVSLLDRQALFFARADALGDPFEGSLSMMNVAFHAIDLQDEPPRIRNTVLRMRERVSRSTPRFTLISCWHEADYESAAMWKLYSGEQNGLAIKSTFKSLSESFLCETPVYIGRVRYVDYNTTMIPDANLYAPYMYKRKSFEHEREVRALTGEFPPEAGDLALASDVCDVGMYYGVDIGKLVEEVVVAPHAEDWFVELVQAVASRYDLKVSVRRSSLADAPTWG